MNGGEEGASQAGLMPTSLPQGLENPVKMLNSSLDDSVQLNWTNTS